MLMVSPKYNFSTSSRNEIFVEISLNFVEISFCHGHVSFYFSEIRQKILQNETKQILLHISIFIYIYIYFYISTYVHEHVQKMCTFLLYLYV
jgi:hypothetical protein